MTMTLAQLAQIEKQALKKGVLMNLLRYSSVMEYLPWQNVSALSNQAKRWRTLPDVAFRKINAGYTSSEGTYEDVWEAVYPLGGEINFDRIFAKVSNTVVDPKVDQVKMKTKAMALAFNNYFINGDHGVDPDGFEGLRKRVSLMPARQTVGAAAAGAAALDPLASAANAILFLDAWEEAHYKANRGEVGAIFVNEGLKWGFGRVLRQANVGAGAFLDATKDTFGRTFQTYKGAPIVDVGLLADQATEIITDTETAGDGGLDASSAYFVSFGTDEGLTGIQLDALEVYDPLNGGEQEAVPAKLVRVEWIVGLANFGSYAFTRLWNFEGASNW